MLASWWLRPALALSMAAAIALAHATGARAAPDPDSTSVSRPDSAALVPQRDVTDIFRDITHQQIRTQVESEPRPGLSLTLLPSVGYNPSYGFFIGASASVAGWLGDPKKTQLSSGSLGASYSTTHQVSVQFRSDFWLPGNQWDLKGDWRYLDTSQPTYGLGPAEPAQQPDSMDFVLYRLYQAAYLRMGGSQIYTGFGFLFDRYDEIRDHGAEAGERTPFSTYSGGTPSRTQSVAISANILIDTRDNPINGARGLYWNASIRSYQRVLGSDHSTQGLWSDFRSYTRLPGGTRNVLAIWSYLWFTFGKPPYLDLPAIGWDTYGRGGRGYLQGRIRATNQLYNEFEYRLRFTRDGLWGGVAFLNIMASTQPENGTFGTLDLGYGVGLRVKFNKKTNTNASVDAARGQDEKTRFFFGLQEVF